MRSSTTDAAIGIFDSGLGGLTVASAVAAALPEENIIYLGDTARVPYGTRSPGTVVRYARRNVSLLRKKGVKLVVVACNTVSAQGVDELTEGEAFPCVGVIRPGAQAAIDTSAGGGIAVLDSGDVRSEAYVDAIKALDTHRLVVQLSCPLFGPLVEEGWLDHPVTHAVVREYLQPLDGQPVDTIILGCTHYPLLSAVIKDVAQDILKRTVNIVDSAHSVAHVVARSLDESNTRRTGLTGHHRFFVTDAPDRVADVAESFWEHSDGRLVLEHIDLVDHGG